MFTAAVERLPWQASCASNLEATKSRATFEQSVTGACVLIEQARAFRGPSIWSAVPVVRLTIDLGTGWRGDDDPSTYTAQRRTAALLARLYHDRDLAPSEAADLQTRTPVNRPIEWVGRTAIALQELAGDEFMRADRLTRRPADDATATFPYRHEELGLAAGGLAVRIVDAALAGDDGNLDVGALFASDVLAVAEAVGYGPSTREIVAAAQRRGVPVARPEPGRLFVVLGHGAAQRRVWATATDRTSLVGAYVAGDKGLTSRLLSDAMLPVPAESVVGTADEAAAAAGRIGCPVVIKPLDGNHGRGVSLDLTSDLAVREAFALALAAGKARSVVVQRQLTGRDYRALVVGGRLVAVSERVPAGVHGDGLSTVQELVEATNADTRRGDGHARQLTRLRLDDASRELLDSQGLSPGAVPEIGRRVQLARTANMSTGGTSIDRTDEIHPLNAALATESVAIVGLDIAGVDIVTPDIARPMAEDGGGIVEINASPGFRMHSHPSKGQARPVGDAVVDMLFPDEATARIPTVAVTGTNGKTTTTRMVAHLLRAAGHVVGLTTTDGIYVGDRLLAAGDMAGPASARAILRHPLVSAAALECARGGIVREGLGFDRCDVAIVTNVSADHLGLGGVETLEDLAEVKQVVPASVRPDGASVLNADDPLVLAMTPNVGGEVILFSADAENSTIHNHLAGGGRAAVLMSRHDGDYLSLLDGLDATDLIAVREIPATLDGRLRVNAMNALAAAAAGWSLGIALDIMRGALSTFRAGADTTPGRFNLIEVEGRQVMIDYAHNVAALEAVGDVVRRFGAPRSVAMLAIPGDRSDADARALARVAAGIFDGLVIREGNTRGRAPGETAAVLREAALAAGMPDHEIRVVLDEVEAAHATVDHAGPGGLAMIFVTHPKLIWDEMRARADTTMKATPDTVAAFST